MGRSKRINFLSCGGHADNAPIHTWRFPDKVNRQDRPILCIFPAFEIIGYGSMHGFMNEGIGG